MEGIHKNGLFLPFFPFLSMAVWERIKTPISPIWRALKGNFIPISEGGATLGDFRRFLGYFGYIGGGAWNWERITIQFFGYLLPQLPKKHFSIQAMAATPGSRFLLSSLPVIGMRYGEPGARRPA